MKVRTINFILGITLAIIILISISIGSAELSIIDCFRVVAGKLPLFSKYIDGDIILPKYSIIVLNIRLPRILLAAMAGGALSVVGCSFQGIFQNALADPHILGVSSGAALGATIATIFQNKIGNELSFGGMGSIGVCAFIGAIMTVVSVYLVSRVNGAAHTIRILLTGTAINTLLSSIISLLLIFNSEQLEKVYMWTMGSFSAANWKKVSFLFMISIVCIIVLLCFSKKLNIIMIGEEEAECVGIDTVKIRKIIIMVSSILVAAVVSVSGVIGFVGLIVPHCIRLITGADNTKVMSYGLWCGAVFLLICDDIARTVAAPTEIPVGIITAICGVPFFLYLVYRSR